MAAVGIGSVCKDATDKRAAVHIRWMIRRDMPEVVEIASAAMQNPPSAEDLTNELRNRNTIGMVAEVGDQVAGFMVYELHQQRIELLTLCVAPDLRRCGVGSQLLAKLFSKLSPGRRQQIECCVPEDRLDAQLFLREAGFLAVDVWNDFYGSGFVHRDAYRFLYRVQWSEGSCDG